MKLCCLRGSCREPLRLADVARLFDFCKREERFGGRLLVPRAEATVWLYASGKILVLGGEVAQASAAYAAVRARLEEGGHASHVSDAAPWNVAWQVEAHASKRLSLRKVARGIPRSRFLRAQRAVFCELHDRVDEVAGHGLVQVYGSGKLLIRARHVALPPEAIRDLIPAIERTG